MFLFQCCRASQNQSISKDQVYRLRTNTSNKMQVQTFSELNQKNAQQVAASTQVLKVKQSDYTDLYASLRQKQAKFDDISFPPNERSLGSIPGITVSAWKRLSKIVDRAVLFEGPIEPQDSIQGTLGDCYFLSAVAALSERPERIKNIFGDQAYNQQGIYQVTLREIVIDDSVPVDKNGNPIFCQPHGNQIWVPLLEKAWAKANGSYANIISGSPSQFFRAATFAPAITLSTGDTKDQHQQLWRAIISNAERDRPCCCGTNDNPNVYWKRIGLVPGHAYTLIDAAQMEDTRGNTIRMVKLRNPWGNTEWQGQGNQSDKQFWDNLVSSQTTRRFRKGSTVNNDGIFFMTFRDFCIYFDETHICLIQEAGNYNYQSFRPQQKHGHFWSLTVLKEDQYTIELHQEGIRSTQQNAQGLSRATIYIVKQNQQYEWVAGSMSLYKQDASLSVLLMPGKYIIFSKFDPALADGKLPIKASISVYSVQVVILSLAQRLSSSKVLKECFLTHARVNKRKKFQNDKLWISWKMLFMQGGYAYIAFGCEKDSKHKWVVNFDQSVFKEGHFKLKKPYKGKGDNQQIVILPGQEAIIVARVVNQEVRDLVFPPKINWKIENI